MFEPAPVASTPVVTPDDFQVRLPNMPLRCILTCASRLLAGWQRCCGAGNALQL
jgi:hypothetical protein